MPSKAQLESSLYFYRGQCIQVTDGDTVVLSIDLGLKVHSIATVRLYEIDTPEIHGVAKDSEEFSAGLAASKRVCEILNPKKLGRTLGSQLVVGSDEPTPLWIETYKDRTGKYGRYLVRIWFESEEGTMECLNDLLVREGLAESM